MGSIHHVSFVDRQSYLNDLGGFLGTDIPATIQSQIGLPPVMALRAYVLPPFALAVGSASGSDDSAPLIATLTDVGLSSVSLALRELLKPGLPPREEGESDTAYLERVEEEWRRPAGNEGTVPIEEWGAEFAPLVAGAAVLLGCSAHGLEVETTTAVAALAHAVSRSGLPARSGPMMSTTAMEEEVETTVLQHPLVRASASDPGGSVPDHDSMEGK